jgi:predicted DNA-binding WGR domain protein
MSDWTVHLEFAEGTSSKFWRARVEGKTLYVNYGKLGSNGQTQVKDLSDPAAAKAEYDKLVRDKRKKGYVDAASAGSTSAEEPTEDDDDEGLDEEDVNEDDDTRPGRKPARKPAAAAPARLASVIAMPAVPGMPGMPGVPGHRLVLDTAGKKVETTLYLDGKTVRMDARETYASPEAAKKALERLKKLLGGEGYKAG